MRVLLAIGIFIGATVSATADICDDLWQDRNAIYKSAGYCFKTTRAIRAFSNAGCSYDELADVPVSARDRADVSRIQARERQYGCP